MIQEGIYSAMMNYAPLQSLVAGRITPVLLPKSPVLPAITFFDVSGSNAVNLDKSALTTTSIEIDCWGKTYLEAKAIQKVLHDLFDGFTGTLSDGTQVKETTSDQNPDFFEKDSLLYRTSTTFRFLT